MVPSLRLKNCYNTPSTTFVSSYLELRLWSYRIFQRNAGVCREVTAIGTRVRDKALYEGTARFFRAYAYRYLVYLYGDVPYVDKIERNYRNDFTRTPKKEVLKHMIEDLEFASANLPEDPDAVEPGKLTKWGSQASSLRSLSHE